MSETSFREGNEAASKYLMDSEFRRGWREAMKIAAAYAKDFLHHERDYTSIDELELSVRTYNALKNANVLTVEDLRNRTEHDLTKIHGLGKKSLKEVREILGGMGLSLSLGEGVYEKPNGAET